MPTRKSNFDVSVFTIGGTAYLGDLENATLTVNVDSEEAKGIADEWNYAWATAKGWTIEADTFVATTAATLTDAASGDALVTVAFTSGGNTYSGNALIKSATHSVGRASLQRQKFSLEGQGALTIA